MKCATVERPVKFCTKQRLTPEIIFPAGVENASRDARAPQLYVFGNIMCCKALFTIQTRFHGQVTSLRHDKISPFRTSTRLDLVGLSVQFDVDVVAERRQGAVDGGQRRATQSSRHFERRRRERERPRRVRDDLRRVETRCHCRRRGRDGDVRRRAGRGHGGEDRVCCYDSSGCGRRGRDETRLDDGRAPAVALVTRRRVDALLLLTPVAEPNAHNLQQNNP